MKKTLITCLILLLTINLGVSATFTENTTFTNKNNQEADTIKYDNGLLYTEGEKGTVHAYNTTNYNLYTTLNFDSSSYENYVDGNDEIMVYATYDGNLTTVWHENLTVKDSVNLSNNNFDSIDVKGDYIAVAGHTGYVHVLNATNLNIIEEIETDIDIVEAIEISNNYIAFGGYGKKALVYNIGTWTLYESITDFDDRVQSIAIQNGFMAVDNVYKFRVYDLDTMTVEHTLGSHNRPISVIEYGYGYLGVGDNDNEVELWNSTDYTLNQTINPGDGDILDIDYVKNQMAVSTSYNDISIWDYEGINVTEAEEPVAVDPNATDHMAYINESSHPDSFKILAYITNTSIDDVYVTDIYNYNKSEYIIGGDSGVPSNTLTQTDFMGYNYSSDSFTAGWRQKYRYNISLEDDQSGNISYYSNDFYVPNTAEWTYKMRDGFNGSTLNTYTFKTNELNGFEWNYDDYYLDIPYDRYNISLYYSQSSNMSNSVINHIGVGDIPETNSGTITYSFDKETIPVEYDNSTVWVKHEIKLYNSTTYDVKRIEYYKTRHTYLDEPSLTESFSESLSVWIGNLIDAIDGFIDSAVDTVTDILNTFKKVVVNIITSFINVISYTLSVIWAGIEKLFFFVFDWGQEVVFTSGNTTINFTGNTTSNVSFSDFITDGYVGNVTYTAYEYWIDNNLSITSSLTPIPLLSFVDTSGITEYSEDPIITENRYVNYTSTPKGDAGEGISNSENCPSFENNTKELTEPLFNGTVNYWSKCVRNNNPRGIEVEGPGGLLEDLYWFTTYRKGLIKLSTRDTVTIKGELSATEPTSDEGGKTGLVIYDPVDDTEHFLYKTKAYCAGNNIQRHRVEMNVTEDVTKSETYNVNWKAYTDVYCTADDYVEDQTFSGSFTLNTSEIRLGWYFNELEEWTGMNPPLNAYETENAWDTEKITYASVNWYELPDLPAGTAMLVVTAITWMNLIISFFVGLVPEPMVNAVISFFERLKTYVSAITSTLASITSVFDQIFVKGFDATKRLLKWIAIYKVADYGIKLWDGFTDERESINDATSYIVDDILNYMEKLHNIAVTSFDVLNKVVHTIIKILHWLRELLPV